MSFKSYMKAPKNATVTLDDGTVVNYEKVDPTQVLTDEERDVVRECVKRLRDVAIAHKIDCPVDVRFDPDTYDTDKNRKISVKARSWVAPTIDETFEY